MKEMQFSAVLLMTLMALALVLFLPRRVSENRVANRSRWLSCHTASWAVKGRDGCFIQRYLQVSRTA